MNCTRRWEKWIFLMPLLVFMITLMLYPVIKGIQISFTDIRILRPGTFIGLRNYQEIFSWYEAIRIATINTAKIVLMVTAGQITLSFVYALLLNEKIVARGLFRALVLLPWLMPSVVAGYTWAWMFNPSFGVINYFLRSFNLISQDILWLGDRRTALLSLAIIRIWRMLPITTVMFLSGLTSIPGELYEASQLDGANWFKNMMFITIPLMKPIMVIVVLITTIWNINNFDLPLLLTRGGPARATLLFPLHAYLNAFQYSRLGYASALSITMMVVLLVFITPYLQIQIKKRI